MYPNKMLDALEPDNMIRMIKKTLGRDGSLSHLSDEELQKLAEDCYYGLSISGNDQKKDDAARFAEADFLGRVIAEHMSEILEPD